MTFDYFLVTLFAERVSSSDGLVSLIDRFCDNLHAIYTA